MGLEHIKITSWDQRRDLLIPGNQEAALDFCLRHFIAKARESIKERGKFTVALSGGSTPKALYRKLASREHREEIDWTKVFLFWGDERSVAPSHEESNFRMAMEAGFSTLPIPPSQIFRMVAEDTIEENALLYEKLLKKHLTEGRFDLVTLGMGEDGHTASLFPQTKGLKAKDRLVVANYVPQKNTWRMTLTFEAINQSRSIAIYVLGESKKETLVEVLRGVENSERYPIQKVGTESTKALWILDEAAASELLKD